MKLVTGARVSEMAGDLERLSTTLLAGSAKSGMGFEKGEELGG